MTIPEFKFDASILLHEDLVPYLRDMQNFKALQHPLVYQVPYSPELNDMINKQYEFRLKKISEVRKEKDWAAFFILYERPYRLQAFMDVEEQMSHPDYWRYLAYVIQDSENLWQFLNLLLPLLKTKKRPLRRWLMTQKEQSILMQQPEEFEIYRGCSDKNKNGISWTLDKEKAIWFAKRFNCKNPLLIEGKVLRKNVWAYFEGRNESEILIDYLKVQDKNYLSLK